MISGTEHVLNGPHAFICDDCQIDNNFSYYINHATGDCCICGKRGFYQVFQTRNTISEIIGSLIAFATILFFAYLFCGLIGLIISITVIGLTATYYIFIEASSIPDPNYYTRMTQKKNKDKSDSMFDSLLD